MLDTLTSPAAPGADSGSRRAGQALGRKGADTRRRLMNAACALLDSISPVAMTAARISRAAGTSSATFYVYFEDVGDLVLALAQEASDDIAPLLGVLAGWRAGLSAQEGARRFVDAVRTYYDTHRAILSIRNMESDRGDARFSTMRANAARLILIGLADLICGDAGGDGVRKDALGRAIVIYAAIERLAATEALYRVAANDLKLPSADDIALAEVAMLAGLIDPARA